MSIDQPPKRGASEHPPERDEEQVEAARKHLERALAEAREGGSSAQDSLVEALRAYLSAYAYDIPAADLNHFSEQAKGIIESMRDPARVAAAKAAYNAELAAIGYRKQLHEAALAFADRRASHEELADAAYRRLPVAWNSFANAHNHEPSSAGSFFEYLDQLNASVPALGAARALVTEIGDLYASVTANNTEQRHDATRLVQGLLQQAYEAARQKASGQKRPVGLMTGVGSQVDQWAGSNAAYQTPEWMKRFARIRDGIRALRA